MMMVAQEEIKPVELELMAFSFIQFSFSMCVRVIGKKQNKNKQKTIGFKKSERTNGRHKIFKKDFVCCFVCLFVFSLFRARFLSSLSCFPSADRCIEMPQIFQRWKRKIEYKFL